MIYEIYLIISAAAVLLTDRFFPIFRQAYSIWAVPVLFIGIFIGLVILQFLCLVLMILLHKVDRQPSYRQENFFRFLLRSCLPVMVFLTGTKIKAEGIEKLPEDENILFVSNHQHDFDPIIIFSAFPNKKISFIGKKDILWEMKFVSKAMSLINCLFIDRENDREAAKTVISAIKYLKTGKRSIGLFPEGYTSKTDELLPLRNGSLKIALKSGSAIAVCVLNNTKSITKNMFRRKTEVGFRLVDVIYPDTYKDMSTLELGDLIHSKMQSALEEMKK